MVTEEKALYDSSKIEYRYLGNTGLRVSILSFGVMLHDNAYNMKELLKICLKMKQISLIPLKPADLE